MASSQKQQTGRRGYRLLVKGGVIFLLLITMAMLAKRFDFDGLFSLFGQETSKTGSLGFVVFAGLLASVAVPRQIISFFAAFLFGLWPGLALALCATAIGCALDYLAGRVFSKHVADLIFGKVQVAARFWTENPFSVSLIIRLMPAGSNFATSLAAGAAGISAIPFFAGSILGYVPQTLVFGLMGSGVNVDSGFQIGLSVVLFALSAFLGLWVYRKNRAILKEPGNSIS